MPITRLKSVGRGARLLLPTSLLITVLATPLAAQVAWDAPLMVAPRMGAGWGIALVDPAPGSGIGVLGTWRRSSQMGLRLGIAEGRRDKLAVYGGVDFSGPVVRSSEDQPFDLDWVAGAGLGVGDAVLFSFPLGLTIGAAIQADGVSFGPYLTPRVVLDAWMGDDRPRDGLDLDLAVDLGVDIAFDPRWTVRFGATLGDREALAIGASFH